MARHSAAPSSSSPNEEQKFVIGEPNTVIGPGFGDVDLSLLKNVPLYKERVRAQFRVEMFNIFNRVNLAQPGANLGSGSSFGWSTSTIGVEYGAPGIGSGEPYNTQLALKIIF